MTLDDRLGDIIEGSGLQDWEFVDTEERVITSKQAILSDLIDLVGYAEDRAEAIAKIKEYCK